MYLLKKEHDASDECQFELDASPKKLLKKWMHP